jgi:hypothetical protein
MLVHFCGFIPETSLSKQPSSADQLAIYFLSLLNSHMSVLGMIIALDSLRFFGVKQNLLWRLLSGTIFG